MSEKQRALGVVMDPVERIKPAKDSTLAMLLAAQRAGFALHYMTLADLHLRDGMACADARPLTVFDDHQRWFDAGPAQPLELASLDVILMRKDPPFDMEYVYATYILERAELAGTLVVNRPAALRDVNEKAYTAWFPELCPPTLITRSIAAMDRFVREQGKAVVKPLDGMGGKSIFIVRPDDPNRSVIFETLTDDGRRYAMIQGFIPDISNGDKRILIVAGETVPWCLARIPAEGESRGNLAAGGRGVAQPLSTTDKAIAAAVAPSLLEKGLLFVGLDVIGDKVTEINVTSPTCIREIDAAFDTDIAGDLMQAIVARLDRTPR